LQHARNLGAGSCNLHGFRSAQRHDSLAMAMAQAMQGRVSMTDLLFIASITVFFGLSWGYVRLCDRLG
jgi:hypothetical protein